MGWSVSEHSEAPRKRSQLDQRLRRLQAAVRSGEGSIHISNAAEKVRLAALAFIKAKRALLGEYPRRDPEGRQSQNLQKEEQRWLSLPTEAIVEEHGQADA
jgi:predicted metal-dependent hydrolase